MIRVPFMLDSEGRLLPILHDRRELDTGRTDNFASALEICGIELAREHGNAAASFEPQGLSVLTLLICESG